MKFKRLLSLILSLGLILPGLGACVSSKVTSQDFAEPLPAHIDPQKRADAIAEMRQKAATTGNAPPSAYAADDPTTEPKNEAEIAALKQELGNVKRQQDNTLSDEEVAARKREFDQLRKQAQSHYQNTVKAIEN